MKDLNNNKITLYDYVNAAISLMIIITLGFVCTFIYKLCGAGNVSYFLQYESEIFRHGCPISVAIVIVLYIVKLILFLLGKGKEE